MYFSGFPSLSCKVRRKFVLMTLTNKDLHRSWGVIYNRVRWVVEFITRGYKISFILPKKMNELQINWSILWIDLAWALRKLGIILRNKIPSYSKMSLIKVKKLIIFFLTSKVDFWQWKVKLWQFDLPGNHKNQHFID